MYDTQETDLVVRYYDEAFGISGASEVGWYASQAEHFGGPVLDLACGTGRLALLLAHKGYEITAIDQSTGMLGRFRAKLQIEQADIQHRIHIENQRMTDFKLDQQFNTVICCDAFFHNLIVEDEIQCLECVARHLTPIGRLVFNLPNPTCDFILKGMHSGGNDFAERGRYVLNDHTGSLLVEQAHAANTLDQTITTSLRVTRYDPQGNEVEKGESNWSSRYLYRYEAIHLLYRCGFEVEALVGDYENGPVTDAGQLIFQARIRQPDPHIR